MSPLTHRIALLRNALHIAQESGPVHGAGYVHASRLGLFDDGLDDLRDRLVEAEDPIAEMRAELHRLQSEERMRREVAKRASP